MKINTYRNHSRLRLIRYTLTPAPIRFNGSGSINRGSIEVDTLQRLLRTHRMLRYRRFLRLCNNSLDRNLLNLLLYVVTKCCTKVVTLILAFEAK